MTTILFYGDKAYNNPINETQTIYPYQNEYIFSKFLSEEVINYYQNKVPSIVLRCSNIYGPTQLIRPDLIPLLIQKCITQKKVSVWNKLPKRDFIFLEDAADAIIKLLDTNYNGVINFGTGIQTSVGSICKILEERSGTKILDLKKSVTGPPTFQCDISLMKQLIDWKPNYSIKSGILKSYEIMEKWSKDFDWNEQINEKNF